MQPWKWSAIERDVLRTIALCVRALTVRQVSKGWFEGKADEAAQKVLSRLENAELVKRTIVEAHPVIKLERPLLTWTRGSRTPSHHQFESLATAIRDRWNQSHRAIEVFTATKRAAAAFGCFVDASGLKHCEATHDLHVAEIFLRYRQHSPDAAAGWLGEAAFPKLGFTIRGMKDPDAFIVSQNGTATTIVEFSGNYEIDHLFAFHEHCAGKAAVRFAKHPTFDSKSEIARLYQFGGTSYELW